MSVKIKVEGLNVLNDLQITLDSLKNNDKLLQAMGKKLSMRVKQAINLHWKWHNAKHPGALSKSIYYVQKNKQTVIVGSASPYANAVFFGTRPHDLSPTPQAVRITTIKRGQGKISFWMLHHPGSKPHNYLLEGLKMFNEHDLKGLLNKKFNKVK